MKQVTITVLFILMFMVMQSAMAQDGPASNPRVIMETSKGELILELFEDKAPLTVKNFLTYINAGFYNGTIFHRVIPGFMIQGGGFSKDMQKKPTMQPIQNEADNGLKNEIGTIAMARTQDPHSATAQFFINTVNNTFLNHKNKTIQGWGYAVFGKVISGMETLGVISSVETGTQGRYRDVPKTPVVILQVRKQGR